MENVIIDKYKNLLSYFEKIILNSIDEDMISLAKDSYLTFTKDLAKLENKNIETYKEKLESLNIEFEVSKSKEEDKEQVDEEKENDYELDSELKNELEKLEKKLEEDLKNPNDLLISTWIDNYMSFVDKNNLDKDNMISHMKTLFKKYDKDNKYVDKIDTYLNKETIIEKEEDKSSLEEKEVKEENTEKQEENSEQVDEEKKESKDESLKIVKVKNKNLNKDTKNHLNLLALLAKKSIGIPANIISYIIYKLYKDKGLNNPKLISFLEKHGYKIENNELLDENGNKIEKPKIEKAKVNFLKQKLMNLNKFKDTGLIKNSYKKNKITSMLLDMKIVQSLKNRFKSKNNDEQLESNNVDIQKGMGKC